jgi:hypothetical protein
MNTGPVHKDHGRIDRPLQQAVRDAYASEDGCPAPEVFLDVADGRLPAARLAEIQDHAQACPACAAEYRLAEQFTEAGPDIDPKDLDYVMERLDAVRPWGPTTGTLRRPAQRWRIPLALAASVLFAVVALRMVDFAPELPDVPDTDVMRGAFIDPVAPRGDLAAAPDTVDWLAIESAAYYRVTIRTIDDTVLWSARITDASAAIPDDVKQKLYAAVTYHWQVTAYNAENHPFAQSTPMDFRILPDSVR